MGQGKFTLSPHEPLVPRVLRRALPLPPSAAAALSPSGMSLKGGIGDHPLHRDVSTLPGPSAAGEQLLPGWIKSLSRERGIWTDSGDFVGLGLRFRCQNLGTALQLPLVELKSLGTSHCDKKDSCNWQGKQLGSARAVFLEMCCDALKLHPFQLGLIRILLQVKQIPKDHCRQERAALLELFWRR